jgi:uncharacterized membrane protein (UPF0127 family)
VARELLVTNQRTGGEIAARVRVADNPWSRMVGLLGKKELPTGEALLIRPCSSVHTFFMRFPMDAIFVNRENQVLKVVREMRPFRFAGARRSHAVIELMGGALADGEVETGDSLILTDTLSG